MADTNAQTKPLTHPEDAPKNDFMALVRHVQDRPMIYIGAIGFVVLILIITGVYRVMQESRMQAASTELLRAQDVTDPAERAAAFAKIADSSSPLAARALYLQGESELEAGNTASASEAFTKLRQQYPDYEFVPEAVEALGLIKEDAGEFGDARNLYSEIMTKWPDSTAAQRQPFNIGRTFEGQNDLPKAIEQYRKQLEVFPGSTIAVRAQGRLDELRSENPDLFPADAPQVDTLTTAPATESAPAEETPAPEAPAAEAPAAEAPATPAPAETPAPAPADPAAPAPSTPQQ